VVCSDLFCRCPYWKNKAKLLGGASLLSLTLLMVSDDNVDLVTSVPGDGIRLCTPVKLVGYLSVPIVKVLA
jgi:hypothetical protein